MNLQISVYGNENGKDIVYKVRYQLEQIVPNIHKDDPLGSEACRAHLNGPINSTLSYFKAV